MMMINLLSWGSNRRPLDNQSDALTHVLSHNAKFPHQSKFKSNPIISIKLALAVMYVEEERYTRCDKL